MGRPEVDYFILDALANDLESLEDILRLMNSDSMGWRFRHPAPFTASEVLPGLQRVVKDGLVNAAAHSATEQALVDLPERVWPAEGLEGVWFRLTPHGRMVHSAWEPDVPEDSGPGTQQEAT